MIDVKNEHDIDLLRQVALLQRRENELLRKRLKTLTETVAELKGVEAQPLLDQELFKLEKTINPKSDDSSDTIGQGSERRQNPDTDIAKKTPKKRCKFGPTAQPGLPNIDVECTLDEADMICPECGGALHPIEGQFDECEDVDVINVRYVLRKIRKQKYRCECSDCQHIETADGPEDKVPGGRYTLDFVIHIILAKYLWHLPLARQTRQMKQSGLNVTTQTLWGQLWWAANLLRPNWETLHEMLLEQEVIGADETRWRLMNGKPCKPYIFALTSSVGTCFTTDRTRSVEIVGKLLGDYSGWLVVDGLNLYTLLHKKRIEEHQNGARAGPVFRIAGCWFHARRYYVKAAKDFPQAERMLDLIAMLFRIEKGAKNPIVDAETRRQWLQCVLGGMREWMVATLPTVLKSSSLGRAILYTDKFWKRLTVFVDHPEVWMHNNQTESALRKPVLGRKNYYGSRSKNGMEAAAIFYSLIDTCHQLGVDPQEYLKRALLKAIERKGLIFMPHDMLPY